MSSLKKVFNSTVIYAGADVINKVVIFLLLPFLTRFLSPYDFGLVATFEAMLGMAFPFVELGTIGAVARGYFNKDSGLDFSKYVTCALVIISMGFVIMITILLFLKNYVSQWLHFPTNWILFIPLIVLATAVINISTRIWIVKQKPLPRSCFQVSQSIFEFALSIFLVVLMRLAWQGRIMGICVSEIIFSIIAIFFLLKWKLIDFSINLGHFKDILKYGLPLIPHSLAIWVLIGIDRFFLNRMIGVSTTGIYNVGYTIGGFISILAGAFGLAWTPFLFDKLNKNDYEANKKIVKFTYLAYIGILFVTLFFVLVSPYLLRIFVSKEFYGANKYIPWIAFGLAMHWMFRIVSGYILYSKKTYFLSIATITAAFINIVFNYIFIKLNGAVGAAQATFLAYTVYFILTWIFVQRVYPMPWLYFIRKY